MDGQIVLGQVSLQAENIVDQSYSEFEFGCNFLLVTLFILVFKAKFHVSFANLCSMQPHRPIKTH